jgi:aryl-alcohol dehydrogenase-like predicted oxidoreductase
MAQDKIRPGGPAVTRKEFLTGASAIAAAAALGPIGLPGPAAAASILTRPIPSSGERIAIVGIGTARIFDVEPGDPKLPILKATLDTFVKGGGRVMDTSPSYGNSEQVFGRLIDELKLRDHFFAATKISTRGEQKGIDSVKGSMQRLRMKKFELLQVHNIKDTKVHLKTIRRLRDEGKVKYIGITLSKRSRYDRFAKVMATEKLDFIQINYSLNQPDSAERILPLAQDKGIAVLINRPFHLGRLFRKAKGKQLPPWAAEFGAKSWAQFFLKFCLGHPAVTAVIPGTDKPEYMVDNLGAGVGPMPDAKTRAKMLAYWQTV